MRLTPFHPRTSEYCEVYNWSLWQNWLLEDMYAPDFEQCIQEYEVITPLDMEKVYNLHEGHPTHGEMTLNQFMWMPPIPGYP